MRKVKKLELKIKELEQEISIILKENRTLFEKINHLDKRGGLLYEIGQVVVFKKQWAKVEIVNKGLSYNHDGELNDYEVWPIGREKQYGCRGFFVKQSELCKVSDNYEEELEKIKDVEKMKGEVK